MTRRFQFSVRAVLAIVLVAAALSAWVSRERGFVRRRVAFLKDAAGTGIERLQFAASDDRLHKVSWLRERLGDRAIKSIFYERSLDHRDIGPERIKTVFAEAHFHVATD
jgi:hypothetical protein